MNLDEAMGKTMLAIASFQKPPTCREVLEKMAIETALSPEQAQRALRAVIDRRMATPGKGLRLEVGRA